MNNRISHLFEPWSAFGNMQDVDELFRRMWNTFESRAAQEGSMSIWQNEHEVLVELDLPGFELEDVDLSIENAQVSIKATPKVRTLDEGVTARVVERTQDVVERTVRVPFDIQAEQAEATLRHGVLSLRLPRSEAQKPKRIAITAG